MLVEPFRAGDVILDKYELVRVLGKGGMGLVFAARHRGLDGLVALEFLLPALRDDAEIATRFDREARTVMRLKNDHVVRVLDVGAADGKPFIVMEHLTGQDLAATIRRRGPLPIAESVDLLLQARAQFADGVDDVIPVGVLRERSVADVSSRCSAAAARRAIAVPRTTPPRTSLG